MRGYEEYNFPAFHAAATELRKKGYEVFSPAEKDEADGFNPKTDEAHSLAHYMQSDLPAVCRSDWVVVLPGWEESTGAKLEVHVARTCDIPVYTYPDMKLMVFVPERPGQQISKGFSLKDSGERKKFDSGMVRDVTEGKTNFSLVLDGPMFKRWGEHMTLGAQKYDVRNWMKASGEAEKERFKESALRHFLQWYWGETDEDHASAVYFNINGHEYVESQANE